MLIPVIRALLDNLYSTNPVIMPRKDGYKVDLMSICTISDHYEYAKTKVHYNL